MLERVALLLQQTEHLRVQSLLEMLKLGLQLVLLLFNMECEGLAAWIMSQITRIECVACCRVACYCMSCQGVAGHETCHWPVWWPYCLSRPWLAHLKAHLELRTLSLRIHTVLLRLFLARLRHLRSVMAEILKVLLRILCGIGAEYVFVSICSAGIAYKHARSRIVKMAAISNQVRLIRVLLILEMQHVAELIWSIVHLLGVSQGVAGKSLLMRESLLLEALGGFSCVLVR